MLCFLLAAAVVVIVPHGAGFWTAVLLVTAIAFGGGLVAGSWRALPLVPLGMAVGSVLETTVRDLPETEDEIPLLFEVLFYVFGVLFIEVCTSAGVLAERLLRRVVTNRVESNP